MNSFNEQELHALLRLVSVPGIGANRIHRLISKVRFPSEVFKMGIMSLTSFDGIDKVLAENICKKNDATFADQQLKICQKLNIRIITYYDKQYPSNLKEINDPPILLFVKGSILTDDMVSLGVVGTRLPSNYGRITTEKITKELVHKGFTIVSGLARGIDTIAHQIAVRQNGRTIAVLGSGLDIIYPSENKTLANTITNHGALVSELPCGTKPDAANFPKRNRIISGLSLGILVTEAGEKSGALITVTEALEQNREIFSVPGNIFSLKSKGTNRLVKEGAKLVQSVEDIFEELDGRIRAYISDRSDHKPIPLDLSEKEKRIMEVLSDQPIHIDVISQSTGFSTSEALSILLALEFKDVVRQFSGKMFAKY